MSVEPSILRSFQGQRDFCRGYSPLYFAFFDTLLGALEAPPVPHTGAARFRTLVEALAAERQWTYGLELALVVGASSHACVLQGLPEATNLARFYPSVGGAFPEDARPAFEDALWRFFASPPAEFERLARTIFVQTNEVTRGIAWLLPALWLRRGLTLPVQLVDLGCSAGLNLVADLNSFRWEFDDGSEVRRGEGEPIVQRLRGIGPDAFRQTDPLQVIRRIGVDRAPRDVRDPAQRLLLRACLFPDQLERLRRFDRAVTLFVAAEDPPQLLTGSLESGTRTALQGIEDVPSWVLAYNTVAASYLEPGTYARLEDELRAGFRRFQNARPLWLELEPNRDQPEGLLYLHARFLDADGAWQSLLLGSTEAHPRTFTFTGAWPRLREAVTAG